VSSRAIAFAPASVGNVAIGFDILGFAVGVLGDRVTATRRSGRGVQISAVRGVAGELALDPAQNTAGQALLALIEAVQPDFGFSIEIDKGIPLGSGLGGSAASAVAAVVAGNALLPESCARGELLKFALAGEQVASGSRHMDNIAPSLYGGLVLTVGIDHPRVKQIPVPPGVRAVVVHPHMFLATSKARAILKGSVPMADFVWQTANLAGFISGCYTDDLDMIRASLEDVVIEPQRQALIPGFPAARRGAMAAGALGCSISGAGPSMFAWATADTAPAVEQAVQAAFEAESLQCDTWIIEVNSPGARVIG
jgi:homoserine kinase